MLARLGGLAVLQSCLVIIAWLGSSEGAYPLSLVLVGEWNSGQGSGIRVGIGRRHRHTNSHA